MKKITSIILAVAIVMSMAVGISAKSVNDYFIGEDSSILLVKSSGSLLREAPPETFLFSMKVSGLSGLLTTSGSKNFIPKNLEYSNIKIAGTLTNSSGKTTKVGTCYYSTKLREYVDDGSAMMPSGYGYTVYIPNNFDTMYKSYKHYGFVKTSNGETVSGTLRFADSAPVG